MKLIKSFSLLQNPFLQRKFGDVETNNLRDTTELSFYLYRLVRYYTHNPTKCARNENRIREAVMKEYFYLISPVLGSRSRWKIFIFPKFPYHARAIRKTSISLESRAYIRHRAVFYYSKPATFTAGSFLLHFPIFFRHPHPPVFPRRISRKRQNLERRRTGARLTKTIKSDFFFRVDEPSPVIIPLRFPLLQLCFLHDPTRLFSHPRSMLCAQRGESSSVLKRTS